MIKQTLSSETNIEEAGHSSHFTIWIPASQDVFIGQNICTLRSRFPCSLRARCIYIGDIVKT